MLAKAVASKSGAHFINGGDTLPLGTDCFWPARARLLRRGGWCSAPRPRLLPPPPSVNMSALGSKWFGEGERLVRALFGLAHKLAPSVVFVGALWGARGSASRERPAGLARRCLSPQRCSLCCSMISPSGCMLSADKIDFLLIGHSNRAQCCRKLLI